MKRGMLPTVIRSGGNEFNWFFNKKIRIDNFFYSINLDFSEDDKIKKLAI